MAVRYGYGPDGQQYITDGQTLYVTFNGRNVAIQRMGPSGAWEPFSPYQTAPAPVAPVRMIEPPQVSQITPITQPIGPQPTPTIPLQQTILDSVSPSVPQLPAWMAGGQLPAWMRPATAPPVPQPVVPQVSAGPMVQYADGSFGPPGYDPQTNIMGAVPTVVPAGPQSPQTLAQSVLAGPQPGSVMGARASGGPAAVPSAVPSAVPVSGALATGTGAGQIGSVTGAAQPQFPGGVPAFRGRNLPVRDFLSWQNSNSQMVPLFRSLFSLSGQDPDAAIGEFGQYLPRGGRTAPTSWF